jgi:hypothetical protein
MGPPITDHSPVREVMKIVGGNFILHGLLEQSYHGCAAVAAAAKTLYSRAKSNPAATPDHASPQPFAAAFDLANVAALQAHEKKEQLRVGNFVQVWSLRGGSDLAAP